MRRRRIAHLGPLGGLAAGACLVCFAALGCSLDGSTGGTADDASIDAGRIDARADVIAPDGTVPEDAGPSGPDATDVMVSDADASRPDADADVADTNTGDTNPADTSVGDTSLPDTSAPDGDVPEGDVHDANVHDGDVHDANVHDANVPDGDVHDANAPDTSAPDTSAPDTGASLTCATYCAAVMNSCLHASAQYGSLSSCMAECAQFPVGTAADVTGNTLGCRAHFASLAAVTPAASCPAAGPYGGGVCGTRCESFCLLEQSLCSSAVAPPPYADAQACATGCAGFTFDNSGESVQGPAAGDTLNCREYHLQAAYFQSAVVHCPHVAVSSATCF